MNGQPYSSYKPTGVEWLGDIPEKWNCLDLKYVATANDDDWPESTAPETEILYVDIGSVDGTSGIRTKEAMLFDVAPSRARRRVTDGDVIVSTVRTYLRAIAPVRDPEPNLTVSTGFAVIRPRNVNPDFLAHSLTSSYFVESVVSISTGVSYPATSPGDILNLPLPFPPEPEQTQISAFLDQETAKIDELIAKKRELIERLKEKRTALISHVVTKGLPPEEAAKHGLPVYPPLKPSGVPWLGDIPSHWELMSLKRCVGIPVTDGPHLTPNFVSEGIPFLSAEGVYDGRVNLESVRGFISAEDDAEFSKKCKPRIEDVLVVKSGSTTGKVGYVGIEDDFNIWSPLALIRASVEDVGRFLYYALASDYFFGQVKVSWSFGTQPNIGMDVLQNLKVVRPPRPEQIEIARFLDAKCDSLDAVIAKTTQAIEKLKEYRSALITAAVTGKIDVRLNLPDGKTQP